MTLRIGICMMLLALMPFARCQQFDYAKQFDRQRGRFRLPMRKMYQNEKLKDMAREQAESCNRNTDQEDYDVIVYDGELEQAMQAGWVNLRVLNRRTGLCREDQKESVDCKNFMKVINPKAYLVGCDRAMCDSQALAVCYLYPKYDGRTAFVAGGYDLDDPRFNCAANQCTLIDPSNPWPESMNTESTENGGRSISSGGGGGGDDGGSGSGDSMPVSSESGNTASSSSFKHSLVNSLALLSLAAVWRN